MDRLGEFDTVMEKLHGKDNDTSQVSDAAIVEDMAISQNAKKTRVENILGEDDLFGEDDDIITVAAQESEDIAAYKKIQAFQQSHNLDLQDEVKAKEGGSKKSSYKDKPVEKAIFDDTLFEEDALEPKYNGLQREESYDEEEYAPTVIKPSNNNTKGKKSRGKSKKKKQNVVEDEQTDEEKEPEEEYEIEQIVAHRIYKGKVVKYEIKWKGYESSENTMENASTIHADVYDLCAAYWDSQDERPINAPKNKNAFVTRKLEAKRKRYITEAESDHIEELEETAASITASASQTSHNSKRTKKKQSSQFLEHVPQYMSDKGYQYPTTWPNSKTRWDTDMKSFSAIQLSPQDRSVRMAYIDWNNGQKTIHTLEECHERCPQQLIRYYEERLQFV